MIFNEQAYNIKTFWRSFWGILAVAALMKASGGAGFVAVAFFALLAMLKGDVKMMLYGMIVANCALLGNQWFFPKDLTFALSHRVLMVVLGVCLAARVFGGRNFTVLSPFALIVPFLTYMIVPSINGWAPGVSILKILLFMLVFIAYVGMAKTALLSRNSEVREFRAMIIASIAFYVFGSAVLLAFPGIGYMGQEEMLTDPRFVEDIAAGKIVSLYKGMTWHSQALGPLISIFCLFLIGDMLFNVRRSDKLYLIMIVICPFLVYKTSSRTAMSVLLCGIATMLFMFNASRIILSSWKSRVMSISMFVAIVLVVVFSAVPSMREGAVRYALKWASVDSTTHLEMRDVMASRQGLMDHALYNWRQKPLLGNGFQVSDIMQYEKRQNLADYLSAPIEKGVWVTAVLEEGGVIGLILFCLFWIPAVLALWSNGYCATSAMLLSFVIMNMAEFTMFSMSGVGGFIWAIIFLMAILEGKQKEQDALPPW